MNVINSEHNYLHQQGNKFLEAKQQNINHKFTLLNNASNLYSNELVDSLLKSTQKYTKVYERYTINGGTSVSETTNDSFSLNNFARTSNCGVLSSYPYFTSRGQLSHGSFCKTHAPVFARYFYFVEQRLKFSQFEGSMENFISCECI